jgi:hypothetical protein
MRQCDRPDGTLPRCAACTTWSGPSALPGHAEAWVESLTEWAIELGFDRFIFWPTLAPLSQLGTFANEVIPGVRARVNEHRLALTGVGAG